MVGGGVAGFAPCGATARSERVATRHPMLAPVGTLTPLASSTVAAPRQVLDAYLLALQEGDCASTRAYAVDRFRTDGELCGHVTVTAHGPYNFERRPSADEAQLAEILTVSGGDPAAMPDGERYWFSTLSRQPDGAWRLSSGGSGP